MRQSLWLTPVFGTAVDSDNSVWGYYADGFFDRRKIVNGAGSSSNSKSSVESSTNEVAYVCRLFFNKATNSSLVFPSSGYRTAITGKLTNAGVNGYYWSSSVSSILKGWSLSVSSNTANQDSYFRGRSFAIRPIVGQ